LLVATQAELMCPVERHGGWCGGREVELIRTVRLVCVRLQTGVKRAG
jgi:hypothetical protein